MRTIFNVQSRRNPDEFVKRARHKSEEGFRAARRSRAAALLGTSQPEPFKAASRIERILVRGGDASVADDPRGTRTGVEARDVRTLSLLMAL